MATFGYPTAATLQLVAQEKLPELTLQDTIFKHFPIENKDADTVMWEQLDIYKGLMTNRGINGQPGVRTAAGLSRFIMQPGYFGDYAVIDEMAITRRRAYGTPLDRMDVSDQVLEKQNQLMTTLVARIKHMLWTLVSTGTYSVANKDGSFNYSEAYTFQTVSGSTWATSATATPLADFRSVKLKQRGYSVRFDQSATAYMNQVTFNNLVKNTNAADLYGKRTAGLATVLGIDDINKVLLGEAMPQIEINDDGYYTDAGVWTPYLADSKVVVVGKRTDGAALGGFQMTANAQRSDGGPGMYSYVYDGLSGPNSVPREIQVHLGFNGGIATYHPAGIVILTVS